MLLILCGCRFFPRNQNKAYFRRARLLPDHKEATKHTDFYDANSQRRLKTIAVLFFFSSWQIHHKGGGAGVCVCVGKEMGTVFFRAPNQKLAPLPLGGVLPLRRPFLSVWCLCQFLSVSLSFSNLIIRLWTFIEQRPQFVGWAGRRGVTQRVGLGCVGGTERMWLCALFCCGN